MKFINLRMPSIKDIKEYKSDLKRKSSKFFPHDIDISIIYGM
jgi:hypothetical protein